MSVFCLLLPPVQARIQALAQLQPQHLQAQLQTTKGQMVQPTGSRGILTARNIPTMFVLPAQTGTISAITTNVCQSILFVTSISAMELVLPVILGTK